MVKPTFNTALGALDLTQQGKPPIRFDGVTARVFPLKANMNRLSAFCDSYLNVAGDIVRFRPAFPYVLLMALDYGKMSAQVENLGWVSQHEVAFAVPLEWYRWKKDRWVFIDFATVCPFIFVDNDMSLTTGREVYGWPKVKVWLEPEVNPWMNNPHDSAHLLSMSTMVYPELYAGKRQEPAVILQIRQQAPSQFTQFPLDLRNGFNPLQSASKMLTGYLNVMGQCMETFTNLPLMGYGPPSAPPPWLNLIMQGPRYLNPLSPPPSTNQITLKQFRDAEHPGHICYQAIVNSEMRLKRYNAGGMLGDLNLLGGDPTGGFEILMRRYAAYPIIESLGIEVGREAVFEGAALACAHPVFPFWLNVDLEYGIGDAICWRTRKSPWYIGSAVPDQTPAADAKESEHRFNTVLGAGAQEVSGPFEFPNTTVRVLPLLADDERLSDFCQKYLNDGLGDDRIYDFKPWGSYVYLVVTNFGEMSSRTNDIGWWAERELTFFVPVKWYDRKGTLLSVALIPAFSFADSETAAITSREIGGQPTVTAVIKSPPSAWLTDSGPTGENQGLLTLETLLLPALHLGQRAESRVLLEITQRDVLRYDDSVSWRMIADGWIQDLKRDLKRQSEIASSHQKEFDVVRALALEILANGQPASTVTLKQFRDVSEPARACYQALVRGGRVIDRIYDIREVEQRVHLRIRRTPSLAIADVLGLKAKWTETTGAGTIDFFQPMRPFWMRLSLSEDLGKNVVSRVSTKWLQEERDKELEMYFQMPDPTGVGCDVLGQMHQRLRKTVQEWRASAPNAKLLTREQARAAVEQIDPQMAIASILSMEWEQWGNPRWYQNMQAKKDAAQYGAAPAALIPDKPDFCIPCHSIGEGNTRQNEFHTPDASAWWSSGIEAKEGGGRDDMLKQFAASLFGSIWKPVGVPPKPEDTKGSLSANKEAAPSGSKPGGSGPS